MAAFAAFAAAASVGAMIDWTVRQTICGLDELDSLAGAGVTHLLSILDPQVNGALGVNFTSPSLVPDQVRLVADECRRHGVGAFLPTVITAAIRRSAPPRRRWTETPATLAPVIWVAADATATEGGIP